MQPNDSSRPSTRTIPASIQARSASPADIARAFTEQMRYARPTRFGPGPLPMVLIPMPTGARVTAARPPGRHVATPARPQESRRPAPALVVAGLATPYNVPLFDDKSRRHYQLAAGAFWSLADVVARIDHHDTGRPLASTADGTLRLFDGPNGLRFQLDPFCEAARRWDVHDRVRSGFFHSTSIRYRVEDKHVGATVDTITRATLIEVSLMAGQSCARHRHTGASLELACTNCQRHGLEGYVHCGRDRNFKCARCGMPYARP